MKKVYFHIGSGRCGSTLIQSLFNDKMLHNIFAQHRRLYDPHIYLDTGLIAHDETFVEAHWQPIRDKFFKPMATMDMDGFFITQENLLGMRPDAGQKNICNVSCEKISYLAEGFEPHIIILIRRQDTYIESLYNQCIKRWELRDFATFVDEFPRENWHWADNIDIYARHFGRANVTVIPFESAVYENSGRTEFLDTVLMAIGITTRLSFKDLPVVNASLAPRAIEVQRVANKFLERDEALALANWFEAHIKKKPDDPHKMMPDEMRQDILAYYRASNTRLCQEYLSDYPAALAYYAGTDGA
ncbi:MAG: hypothetical protein WD075_00765 [Rhodospirillales bacterium]